MVLNQVPANAGEDYGYYTRNYEYYSARGQSDGAKRAAGSASGEKGDAKDRIRLREEDRA